MNYAEEAKRLLVDKNCDNCAGKYRRIDGCKYNLLLNYKKIKSCINWQKVTNSDVMRR